MVQEKPVAVILAAGLGTRMGSGVCKPLVLLFNMPIIEHSLRALIARDFNVLVVYSNPALKEYLYKRFPKVQFVRNPHPERENGYSLYVAKDYVKDDFLLLMSDHYYSESFFERAAEGCSQDTAFVSSFCHDPQEATKVKVQSGKVVAIGKGLQDYNFYDTGMFYCTQEVLKHAERLVRQKHEVKLAEVFQSLADEGKLSAEIVEGKWIDIDTKEELKIAEEILREQIVKSEDGIISKCINRRVSLEISRFLIKYDFVTPNRLTVFSTLMGFITALLFYYGHYFIAGLMAQVTSIFDGCDGEIARIKHQRSRFGAVLDSVSDRYADIAIYLGMALSLSPTPLRMFAMFLACTGSIIFSYVWHLTKVRVREGGRDMRLFITMIGGVLSAIYPKFIILTLLAVGLLSHTCALISLYKFRTTSSQ